MNIRVNNEIQAREVRLISPEGEQLGVVLTREALSRAETYGLDLVEIAATATPPVCKILDFGKYKYELSKKAHSSRQHQKTILVKEVKLRINTDTHDLEIKKRNVQRFLADGNKAKITVMFRGREKAHTELGRVVIDRFLADITSFATIEQAAKLEGNAMSALVSAKQAK
ncbi:MAG: translation initiation factor IF-3 [Nitrospirae bacterium]|nr:translation initiation factor IF-3 [Nitrospirota bacterium]MBI3392000.1 translation initiation factor IF-3 [Nitrospirota bacterium]